MENIVLKLTNKHETISTMESCTGGALANYITNIPGASKVFKFGAITYSNEYKIKLGVNAHIIDKYSVYSSQTAKEMSKTISNYTNSTYGVGITGKLMKNDINNPFGKDNVVYISVYDSINNKYHSKEIIVTKETREDNKNIVLEETLNLLNEIIL